ncbi:hypothetical protein IE4771_CH01067 [Rhizobium etli bv. mimosae str. IE4771]|uniref:Pentapeptide repeat-containing protein n=1 Tax=Rhizobium etli bv. mimosae str. IE4771 TaxID=1432050 RepID=A0A060HXJ5_RHIET|nr:hypothetical protein [Rhizobium sp. IE4771]AIC26219.1 hypothetical protein IE4771_CH01067 [Rhizobium sp. IE4771]
MAGTEKKTTDQRSVGDWPVLSESHWYSLAITSAVFTAIAVVAAFISIFGNGFDGDADLKMAQGLAPFGVALFAVVTFCTVGWRGSINTRQANQSESEGRAKLLQEGAKLLGETEKASHVSAGIATLGVLVAGPDKEYAFQSMNLLADFVEDHMRLDHTNRHRPQISGVMRTGEQNGINTGREISFDCTNYSPDLDQDHDDYETVYWHYIPGFELIRYKGGAFSLDEHYNLSELENIHFNNVEIRGWNQLLLDDRFYRCRFSNCDIHEINSMLQLDKHNDYEYAFDRCDFSGCKIHVPELITKNLKKEHNYYVVGNPPVLVGMTDTVDWAKVLLCEERKPGRGFY